MLNDTLKTAITLPRPLAAWLAAQATLRGVARDVIIAEAIEVYQQNISAEKG